MSADNSFVAGPIDSTCGYPVPEPFYELVDFTFRFGSQSGEIRYNIYYNEASRNNGNPAIERCSIDIAELPHTVDLDALTDQLRAALEAHVMPVS